MRLFHRPLVRAVSRHPAVLVAAVLASGCLGETSGPNLPRAGQFQLVPFFQTTTSSGMLSVERVRILLVGADSSMPALDTVIRIAPHDSVLDLNLPVAVLTAADTFTATLALVNAAGDTVFRGGPVKVVASTRNTLPAASLIPIVYSGIGADADSVVIVPAHSSMFSGDTLDFTAVAYDNDVPVPGTPIAWISLDPARASVANVKSGRIVGNEKRGAAHIVAQLLNGPADTALVTVKQPPANIGIASGNLQIARLGSRLPLPLVAHIKASDGQPVADIWVKFTVLGGGSITADSALTDAAGRASVEWTLGPALGPQLVEASSPRLPGARTLFAATGVPAAVAAIWTNLAGGLWSAAANWSTGLVPGLLDTVVINLAGTYSITLDKDVSIAGLVLGAASGTQTLLASGRSLALAGTTSIDANGILSLTNSTLSGSGLIKNEGWLTLQGSSVNLPLDNGGLVLVNGTSTLNGRLTTAAGSILRIQGTAGGNAMLSVDDGFINNGTIEILDAGSAAGATLTVNKNVLTNAAGGTIASLLGAGGTRTLSAQLDNHGTVLVAQSLMIDRNSGTHGNSGTFDLQNGTLTVTGNMVMDSASSLKIHVAGASQYGRLAVYGQLTLAGDLRMDFTKYAPALLAQYQPVSYNNYSGGFRSTSGLGLVSLLLSAIPGVSNMLVTILGI